MRRAFTDIHSHILPGADDGAQSQEQAIKILKAMEELGVKKLILTPHYCRRRGYTAKPDAIKNAYDNLCKKCKEENIGTELYLGMEMEYSIDAVRYINEGRILTLADSQYILVEFPPYVCTDTIVRAVRELLNIGLIPVIAHIERYGCFYKNFEVLYMLKDIGAMLQVNIHSLASRRIGIRRFLRRVIAEQLADYIAGDVHGESVHQQEFDRCCRFILKHSSAKYLEQLLMENAQKIFDRR